MVGDQRGSSSRVRGGYDVVGDDSSMVDVMYPAKKSKAQMWRKVSSKKLEPEPIEPQIDPYYDGPDMDPPGWSGYSAGRSGHSGHRMQSAYGRPPSRPAYRN